MFNGLHNPTPLKEILLWAAFGLEAIIAVLEIAIVYKAIL